MALPEPCQANGWLAAHAALILAAHARLVGRPLLGPEAAAAGEPAPGDAGRDQATARALYHSPLVILAHDAAEDPVFTYGNLAAQRRFELSWAELTALPSRCSAEPLDRAERARLLEAVARRGFIDDYAGVRVSRTGRRFRIERTVVWNLVDEAGRRLGQAAAFDHWTDLPPA